MGSDRSHYALPQDKFAMPRWYRRGAESLDPGSGSACKDYHNKALAAGVAPFPPTAEKFAVVEAHLLTQGCKNVRVRMQSWGRGLIKLPGKVQQRAGVTGHVDTPRHKSKVNAPRGTFLQVETGITKVTADATRPIANICDLHEPCNSVYVKGMGRRILVMATRLEAAAIVDMTVNLHDLLSVDHQKHHIKLVDEAIARGEPIKFICEDLEAIRFFAARVLGADSDSALFALAQASARRMNHDMTDGRVRHLNSLRVTETLKAIRAAPDLLL